MKIVLAEDTMLVRAGLSGLLRTAGHQVTAVEDAEELTASVSHRERPELIISDVQMPPTMTDDGLRAIHHIQRLAHAQGAELPALVLSQYIAEAYLDGLIDHGGFGYLLKERVANVFLKLEMSPSDDNRRVRAVLLWLRHASPAEVIRSSITGAESGV